MPPETFRLSPYPLRAAPHWGSACRDPFTHCGKFGEGVEVLGGKGRLRRPLPPKGTSPPPANLHHFVDRATAGGPSAALRDAREGVRGRLAPATERCPGRTTRIGSWHLRPAAQHAEKERYHCGNDGGQGPSHV